MSRPPDPDPRLMSQVTRDRGSHALYPQTRPDAVMFKLVTGETVWCFEETAVNFARYKFPPHSNIIFERSWNCNAFESPESQVLLVNGRQIVRAWYNGA